MRTEAVIERARRLLDVPSVVGFEDPLFDVLSEDLTKLGRSVRLVGSVLVAEGEGQRVLSAHADRHGLVTLGDGLLGYAARRAAGEHQPLSTAFAGRVCSRFRDEDVVAYDAESGAVVGVGRVEHAAHCGLGPELLLDSNGLEALPAGIPVAFAAGLERDGDLIKGQLDNVLSVALAFELIAGGFDVTALFTRGEEAGRSWIGLSAYFADSEFADLLVLDTSPFDEPDVVRSGTVVLRRRDATGVFAADLVERIERSAGLAGVDTVFKDELLAAQGRPLGRTELGRLVSSTSGRLNGATVQVPTTDYHTNRETTSHGAITNVLRVLAALYERD